MNLSLRELDRLNEIVRSSDGGVEFAKQTNWIRGLKRLHVINLEPIRKVHRTSGGAYYDIMTSRARIQAWRSLAEAQHVSLPPNEEGFNTKYCGLIIY